MKLLVLVALFCVVPALADPVLRQKRNIITSFARRTSSVLSDVANTATDVVKSSVDAASDVSSTIKENVVSATKGAVDTVANVTSNIHENVVEATVDAVDAVSDVTGAIKDTVTDVTGTVTNLTSSALDRISDTFTNLSSSVEKAATKAVSDLSDKIFGTTCKQGLTDSTFAKVVKALWDVSSCFVGKASRQLLTVASNVLSILVFSVKSAAKLVACPVSSDKLTTCVTGVVNDFRKDFADYFDEVPKLLGSVGSALTADAVQCVATTVLSSTVGSVASKITSAGCKIASWF